MKVKISCLCVAILCWSFLSCNKKEFLDERPNSDVFVPTTLDDFQALLDNEALMNVTPVLGELSADNFYIPSTFWNSLGAKDHNYNAYIWLPDIYNGAGNINDWNAPYKQVLYANVVLDGLKNVAVTASNWQQFNNMKGSALFTRAYAFYNLAQVFTLPYSPAIANDEESGIPLKLTPNVDEIVKRSTLEQTYKQILDDLLAAKDLLPETVSYSTRNRPNKPAALAQLARVYLSMRQYDNARRFADSSIRLKDTIMDYNLKDTTNRLPFDPFNPETLYQSRFVDNNILKGITVPNCIVDTVLYRSYAPNDLRRPLFFITNSAGNHNIKGSYSGTIFVFTGLATDEMYLVRAECRARTEDLQGAMNDLNKLLQKRWKKGTFVPYTAQTTDEALDLILTERRKELPFRGVRWTDIRRLNIEDRNIVPRRNLNQGYELPVNSPLYALLIPPDVVIYNRIKQNDR